MDKSVNNNFDDVDDTMSSVYNAWRKQTKYSQPAACYLRLARSLFKSFLSDSCGFSSLTSWLNLDNSSEQWKTFLLLLQPSGLFELHKKIPKATKIVPLTTQVPQNNFFFFDKFSDEMLESENSSMAERLYDLERQVLEQQEEILSLKSTLSEVLRRLNNLDCNSSRISSSTSSSSSYETTIKNNRSEYRL